jgi:hypothetical protein
MFYEKVRFKNIVGKKERFSDKILVFNIDIIKDIDFFFLCYSSFVKNFIFNKRRIKRSFVVKK